MMRFHDYQLKKYEVTDKGRSIAMDLAYDHPGHEVLHSYIRFSNVVFYNFIHTNDAIIVNIDEVPVPVVIEEMGSTIVEWNRLYGIRRMDKSIDEYLSMLKGEAYKAWRIESTIGFFGVVIAQAVLNDFER